MQKYPTVVYLVPSISLMGLCYKHGLHNLYYLYTIIVFIQRNLAQAIPLILTCIAIAVQVNLVNTSNTINTSKSSLMATHLLLEYTQIPKVNS